MRRIPFDSLALAAALAELRPLEGGRVQRVLDLDEHTVALAIYADRVEHWILLSCDPVYARVHQLPQRPNRTRQAGAFALALRSKLDGARLARLAQVGFDRIAHFDFEAKTGMHRLVAELMGRHANLMLVGPDGRISGVSKPVGPSVSRRPVTVGRTYLPPPLPPKPSVFTVDGPASAAGTEGASPFLLELLAAESGGIDAQWRRRLEELAALVNAGSFQPVRVPGVGAYPVSVAALYDGEQAAPSFGAALHETIGELARQATIDQGRHALRAQLERVLLARDVALNDLRQAADAAARARQLQELGELILAFGHSRSPDGRTIEAIGYDGQPVVLTVDPERSVQDNAQRHFDKAKRAKASQPEVLEQLARIARDRDDVERTLTELEQATDLESIVGLRERALARRWLHPKRFAESRESKADDPFGGHRIRTLLGPGGVSVLYGENATSNDFLTQRIAKPNDYWLHVRGHASAHVIIQTHNRPERIGPEALRFAAEVAVRQSTLKHSGYVPVDYTLKKYVRKPKGSPPGAALYTHERTLHIELRDQ